MAEQNSPAKGAKASEAAQAARATMSRGNSEPGSRRYSGANLLPQHRALLVAKS